MTDSVTESASGAVAKARSSPFAPKPPIADRLPPHAHEAEQGVLGCVLLSPNDCLGQCIEKLRAGVDTFYDLRHQNIYTVMVEMYDRREVIDIITVQQKLKDRGMLDQIGGIPYLNALQDAVPSAANLSYYTDIISEKHLLRKTILTCTSIVSKVYDHEGEVDVLMDEVEVDMTSMINARTSGGRKLLTIKEGVLAATTMIEKAADKGGMLGMSTGFGDLDKLTGGMMGGEMIVVAARPSVGKTALAMNIVEHVACSCGLPTGVFSLDMTTDNLVLRLLCSVARVDGKEIRQGNINSSDIPKLTMAAGRISKAPIFIDDTPGLSITQVSAKARRWVQLHSIRLLVVDYMQKMCAPKKGDSSREQEVSRISGGLANLSKDLGIPIIVLSQLNRNLENNGGKKSTSRRPRMSDLRESGSIEQDADFIGLLYRPDEEDGSCAVNLEIAKQRNGPRDVTVNLTYLPEYTRFESAAKINDDDVPRNQSNDA